MVIDSWFRQEKVFLISLMTLILVVITSCSDDKDSQSGNVVIPIPSPPSWASAEMIQNDDTKDAFSPQIAMDGTGAAIAIWQESLNIWTNRFDGVSWGTAELIEDDTGWAVNPQIAMDGTGNAIAVWQQDDGIRDNIWANRFDGISWSTAQLIEANNSGDADNPQIAMDSTGNAIAVWQQNDGIRDNIWANRFDGVSWGTAELIENDDAGWAVNPQIAMDGTGNAIAVWQQDDGIRDNIWANRFDGISWSTAQLIELDNAGSADSPKIAIDSTGTAVAVWNQYNVTAYSTWANYFDGAAWSVAEPIGPDNTFNAQVPQIAMDGTGNAIAVWMQTDSNSARIWTKIWANFFNGVSWSTAELIEMGNTGNAVTPDIAMDSTGTAIAIWEKYVDFNSSNIWANRFDGTGWGSPIKIEMKSDGFAREPQIAMDGNGNATAVWYYSYGILKNVWGNRFGLANN